MKYLTLALLTFGLSVPAMAAPSVCLFQIPDTAGWDATISCDGGKNISVFQVSDSSQSKQSQTLQNYLGKGYKIITETHDAGYDQYTLVKD
jgi:hypothetical protein